MRFKIIIITILFLQFLLISKAFSVPAYPYKVMVKTGNGKGIAIYMKGDENRKYAVTTDGYTLLSDEEGWWYAKETDQGKVVKSSFKLMATEDETDELRQFKVSCMKNLLPENSSENILKAPQHRRATSNEPIIGERHALVILMQFKDVPLKTKSEDFVSLFNTIDYHENNVTGSVRDFYRFASQSQLDYISDIYGPYTSQNVMSYYGKNTSSGGSDAHALELCIEAMKSLPDTIDFSRYDNDKDGLIDNVHIIFSGYGEEAGGPSNAIWSHEYPHRINLKNEIGYSLAGYSCSPELRGNSGADISYIGVVCHELGHALGAMDYYDTNYGTGGEYDGTGKWDIMASGSWNDDGRTPPNFNPYVRSTIFGWNKQEVMPLDEQITMLQMELDNAAQTPVYRINTGSDGDYFLLENRQKRGFDTALPGSGLMIYHVHPYIDIYRLTNTINATHPQGMYPVCASGSTPNTKNYGEINTAGCPFPGTKSVKTFSPSSIPTAIAWDGSPSSVSLFDITQHSSTGAITLTTGKGNGETIPDNPDEPTENDLIYKESFETNITGRLDVISIMGKTIWRTYKKGDFVMNIEYIPDIIDGNSLLMLFSGKENAVNESELISNEIAIVPGENYIFSFDLCTKVMPNSRNPVFNLYIEDDFGEYKIYSQNEDVNTWRHEEIPIVLSGDKFKYKLHGIINSGGIFIDNIRVHGKELPSMVSAWGMDDSPWTGVYNISGLYLGDYNVIKQSLRPGMYFIRKAKTVHKIVVRRTPESY